MSEEDRLLGELSTIAVQTSAVTSTKSCPLYQIMSHSAPWSETNSGFQAKKGLLHWFIHSALWTYQISSRFPPLSLNHTDAYGLRHVLQHESSPPAFTAVITALFFFHHACMHIYPLNMTTSTHFLQFAFHLITVFHFSATLVTLYPVNLSHPT